MVSLHSLSSTRVAAGAELSTLLLKDPQAEFRSLVHQVDELRKLNRRLEMNNFALDVQNRKMLAERTRLPYRIAVRLQTAADRFSPLRWAGWIVYRVGIRSLSLARTIKRRIVPAR
jgi:hypothetical protein